MVRQKDKESIRFFMAESSLFVYEDDCLNDAMAKMKKFDVSFLTVVKKDLTILGIIHRKDVYKELTQNISGAEIEIKNCLKHDNSLLLLYPMSTTFEAVVAMKTLKRKAIPVANNPWEKKLVGILWLSDIKNIAETTSS